MDFEILTKKAVVDGKIDLLSNVLLVDYDKIAIEHWILVDEHTQMGLDLIAEKLYGDASYIWVLIKFNRISNPLELNIGDIVAVPVLDEFFSNSRFVDYAAMTANMIKQQSASFKKMKSSSAAVKAQPSANFIKKSGNVIF